MGIIVMIILSLVAVFGFLLIANEVNIFVKSRRNAKET